MCLMPLKRHHSNGQMAAEWPHQHENFPVPHKTFPIFLPSFLFFMRVALPLPHDTSIITSHDCRVLLEVTAHRHRLSLHIV